MTIDIKSMYLTKQGIHLNSGTRMHRVRRRGNCLSGLWYSDVFFQIEMLRTVDFLKNACAQDCYRTLLHNHLANYTWSAFWHACLERSSRTVPWTVHSRLRTQDTNQENTTPPRSINNPLRMVKNEGHKPQGKSQTTLFNQIVCKDAKNYFTSCDPHPGISF